MLSHRPQLGSGSGAHDGQAHLIKLAVAATGDFKSVTVPCSAVLPRRLTCRFPAAIGGYGPRTRTREVAADPSPDYRTEGECHGAPADIHTAAAQAVEPG